MHKYIRKPLVRINDKVGRAIGFKLRKIPHSRPSTIRAKEMFGDRPLRIVEIGCAAGNNALDILTKLNVREYVAIDPYERAGSDYDDYNRARLALMREQSKRKLRAFDDRIRWIYKPSLDAVADLQGPYDFIYVDGPHTYPAVLQDMTAYYPLLAERSVFGGHDIDRQGVATRELPHSLGLQNA